jgi:hypothetical protein
MVECLASSFGALSSNPNTTKRKTNQNIISEIFSTKSRFLPHSVIFSSEVFIALEFADDDSFGKRSINHISV